ncbi:hypothetical protein pb186bvf_015744 [Paramecium bursaria]
MLFAPDILVIINELSQHRLSDIKTDFQINQKILETLYQSMSDRAAIQQGLVFGLDQIQKNLDIQEQKGVDNKIVELVQGYRSVILCEKEQQEYLRDSLKNDLLQSMKSCHTQHNKLFSLIDSKSREADQNLRQHMKQLKNRVKSYQQTLVDMHHAQELGLKDKIDNEKFQTEVFLKQALNSYNEQIDDYFESCARQVMTYKQIEKERRLLIKDTIMKLQVFHISVLKNIEYSVQKLNNIAEQFQENKEIYEYIQDQEKPMLNKFNVLNYMQMVEEECFTEEPSLKIKSVQAKEEIRSYWRKLKLTISNSQQKQLLTSIISGVKFEDYQKFENEEQLDLILNSIMEYQLSEQAKSSLIELNRVIQNLHRFLVDLIMHLYRRYLTDSTIKVIRAAIQKYDSLQVSEDLKPQLSMFRDSILQIQPLQDKYFCLRHLTLRIHSLGDIPKEEILAEIIFQSGKLIKHYFNKELVQQAIQQMDISKEDIDYCVQNI